jgi:hypothetical protein
MSTRGFYRIGSALSLAFVFGGSAANAQVGGPAPSDQLGSPAAGVPADGTSKAGQSQPADGAQGPSDLNDTKALPPPPTRMSAFNRVTTTNKEVVRAQSQASRAGVLHPYTSPANARAKTANPGIPIGSTSRQEPKQPTRPSATAVRSVTHNYYPTLRPGQHVNGNKAQVGSTPMGRNAVQSGVGIGMGLGTGMTGSKAAQTARPGRR